MIQSLLDQAQTDKEKLEKLEATVQKDAEIIRAKDFKIDALTLELAHMRRVRYSAKCEALILP